MDAALVVQADVRTRANAAMLSYASFGEALLFVALGANAFVLPRVLSSLDTRHLATFLLGLLYIIPPIGGLLRRAPTITEGRAAWNRIRAFEAELASSSAGAERSPLGLLDGAVRALPVAAILGGDGEAEPARAVAALSLEDVCFQYPEKEGRPGFGVGPVSVEVKRGEIAFIVGGNGSGKTTLARLVAGLYRPSAGTIRVDGVAVGPEALGELVSVVFADFHLFPRLYDVSLADKLDVVRAHLDTLQLRDKVMLDDAGFTTLELSTGQRKRLALLKCLLEDRAILLFDEWAADQDPEFRHIFYRSVLPALRDAGKLIVAITHDERYFEVADKLVHLEFGRVI
jgi:ABC-type siderophore export system fused ATPase/permease subunit